MTTTQLTPFGLPPIISVSIAGKEVPSTSSVSGIVGQESRRISLLYERRRDHALLVAFSKPVTECPELDCQWACLLLQPPSRSQRRLVKHRGWAPVNVSHVEGQLIPTVRCYWIKVSEFGALSLVF
jgi:hypothetical protein